MKYKDIVNFHGHSCPGLAIGYRMALAGMDELNAIRSDDEEIVAIVENDACGVDALQCITGCTFGKGNLRFRDYGKSVYTLYSRNSKKGIRILFHGKNIPENLRDDRNAFTDWLMDAPLRDIISIEVVDIGEPEPARIRKSVLCSLCGESVMETRTNDTKDGIVCIPCYNR